MIEFEGFIIGFRWLSVVKTSPLIFEWLTPRMMLLIPKELFEAPGNSRFPWVDEVFHSTQMKLSHGNTPKRVFWHLKGLPLILSRLYPGLLQKTVHQQFAPENWWLEDDPASFLGRPIFRDVSWLLVSGWVIICWIWESFGDFPPLGSACRLVFFRLQGDRLLVLEASKLNSLSACRGWENRVAPAGPIYYWYPPWN